jgi:hypothetical protein
MTTVSISIDVPTPAAGIRFYSEAFGFTKTAEPYPGLVVLHADGLDRAPGPEPLA